MASDGPSETIPRERHPQPTSFGGERLSSAVSGQAYIEHYHRYLLAREFCRDRDVVDVAAGEGYGTALLAQVARSAIGIELDAAVVEAARAGFSHPNLRYLAGDARAIPLADGCADVVVSFETIEHLDGQERFLDECRRILRPGGLLIISTPDRAEYDRRQAAPNPYHVKELDEAEFTAMLRARFAETRMLRQRPLIGSAILSDIASAPVRSFDRVDPERFVSGQGLPHAPYLIAFASDAQLPQPLGSMLVWRDDLDTDFAARLAAEERQRAAEQRVRKTEARVRAAQQRALAAEAALAAFEGSLAGRAARRAQGLMVRYPQLLRPLRRGALAGWWTLSGQLPLRWRMWRANQRRLGALMAPLPLESVPAPETIRLPPPPEAPDLTVLVPSYGQVPYTLRCLASIAANPPRASFEVILADDPMPAPDPQNALYARVPNLRVITHPENLGFLRSCNRAAQQARGRCLVLLNNDTQVLPGALDALLALADADPSVGLVGAKLLFPDGTLQEAGGIVWDDGSAWNYGRGQDPARPEFNYVREADYCSAAAVLVPRHVWETLGGFDEAFVPAYCEDSDLAFRIRAAGWRTLYQPRAEVVHYEGVSHGTDTGSGVKAYQIANSRRLAERWATVLQRDHFPKGNEVPRARDKARDRKVVLVIDHYVPEPDRDAGSRTMLEHLRTMLAAGWVVKFWPDNLIATPRYTEALQAMGIEVFYAPYVTDFEAWITENAEALDAVYLSRPNLGRDYAGILREAWSGRLVFYGHDLHHQRMAAMAAFSGEPAHATAAQTLLAQERTMWRQADVSLYPSEAEAEAARALEPGARIQAIPPYAFDSFVKRDRPVPASGGLLFVAGFAHRPNVDAALWLVREVLPLLKADIPDLRLTLAGSNPAPEILALAGPGIVVTGSLSAAALAEVYGRARVAVVPLRYGAGVKLKVVEAMREGVPVVTTSPGTQGLPGLAEILPVWDEPEGFARAVLDLLRDDAAWLRQSIAQSAYVEARFSSAAMREALLAAFA
jgi:O-antigen biosynthesis protein